VASVEFVYLNAAPTLRLQRRYAVAVGHLPSRMLYSLMIAAYGTSRHFAVLLNFVPIGA
jgi:hypothetical protein